MTFNIGHFNRIRFNRSEEVPVETAEANIALSTSLADTTNWLADWAHRKLHTVTATEEQTNYPVRLTIHRTSGTDSDDDVYIGSGCDATYKDIRFTLDDGITLLDYAFPPDYTPDSSSAVIDILIPSITSSGLTIYVYYGNSSATDASDPDAVYLLHDLFTGSSIDAAKWTSGGSHVTVTGGELTLLGDDDAGGSWIKSLANIGEDVIVTARLKSGHFFISFNPDINEVYGFWSDSLFIWAGFYADYATGHGGGMNVNNWWGGSYGYTSIPSWSAGVYKILECQRQSVLSRACWSTNHGGPNCVTTAYQTFTGKIYLLAQGAGTSLNADFIYVRKSSPVQPTHGAWGSEEDAPLLSLSTFEWYPVAAEKSIELAIEVGTAFVCMPAERSIELSTEVCPVQVFQDLQDLHQIAFTTGKHAPDPNGIVVGATSGTRARVIAITLDSGTWGVDAAGTLYVRILSGGGFIPGEKINEA